MLSKIYGAKPQNEIIEAIVNEFKKSEPVQYIAIYNKYLPFIWSDRSPYTARDMYQHILKAIDKAKISKSKKELIEKYFTLDTSFFTALNVSSAAREIERSNDKTEFSVSSYMHTMNSLKEDIVNKRIKGHGVQSDADAMANAMVVFLGMSTGRRTLEILKTVSIVKDRSGIYFEGLAKKGDEVEKYVAVLLDDDLNFVKKCLAKVQEHFKTDDLTGKEINSKFSGLLNRAAAKFTNDKDVSMHTLRERYAEVCVLTKKPDELDAELYREMVLGHETKLKAVDFYKSQKGVK